MFSASVCVFCVLFVFITSSLQAGQAQKKRTYWDHRINPPRQLVQHEFNQIPSKICPASQRVHAVMDICLAAARRQNANSPFPIGVSTLAPLCLTSYCSVLDNGAAHSEHHRQCAVRMLEFRPNKHHIWSTRVSGRTTIRTRYQVAILQKITNDRT